MDDDTLQQSLGRVVRAAREQAGLTQSQLAEQLGLDPKVYGSIERGLMMPALTTVRRLAVALDLPADRLLGLGPQGELSPELYQLVDTLRGQPGWKVRLAMRLLECLEQEMPSPQ